MHEMDKEAFAAFLTELRKEKDYTQKELAEKLFVSDKAVSKWERALSMPDISLLIPLAEILEVTVTELLEGQRLEEPAPMEAEAVELLVKKALSLTEEEPSFRKKNAWIYAGAVAAAALEWLAVYMLAGTKGFQSVTGWVLEGLSAGFGLYFWLFMRERLPSYYDENVISVYSDGFLHLNIPGAAFNNNNWPYIVKTLRVWSVVTMVTIPVLSLLLVEAGIVGQMVLLALYLVGLFLPVYLAARRRNPNKQPMEKRQKATLIVLAVLLPVLLFLPGKEASFNTVQIGYFSNTSARDWSASYSYFSGTKIRTLYPETQNYVIQVETKGGTLSIDVEDEEGLVFTQAGIQSGAYPITLDSETKVTLRADGHKGSFAIVPMK